MATSPDGHVANLNRLANGPRTGDPDPPGLRTTPAVTRQTDQAKPWRRNQLPPAAPQAPSRRRWRHRPASGRAQPHPPNRSSLELSTTSRSTTLPERCDQCHRRGTPDADQLLDSAATISATAAMAIAAEALAGDPNVAQPLDLVSRRPGGRIPAAGMASRPAASSAELDPRIAAVPKDKGQAARRFQIFMSACLPSTAPLCIKEQYRRNRALLDDRPCDHEPTDLGRGPAHSFSLRRTRRPARRAGRARTCGPRPGRTPA